MRLSLLVAVIVAGCTLVARPASTYSAETMASLARQEEAAAALLDAARRSRADGDLASCATLAGPALLIQAKARPQACRALFLAGLQGTFCPVGDPGIAPDPVPADRWCSQ